MSLIVQKFGGTSVADTERLKNVADIVTSTAKAGNQVVVVVSAQGDTTDDLIEKAAELNDRPSKREMDVLLNAVEFRHNERRTPGGDGQQDSVLL